MVCVWFMDVRVQMDTHGHTCRHQSRLLNASFYCSPLYCLEMRSLVALLARLAGKRAPRFNLFLPCNTKIVLSICSQA